MLAVTSRKLFVQDVKCITPVRQRSPDAIEPQQLHQQQTVSIDGSVLEWIAINT